MHISILFFSLLVFLSSSAFSKETAEKILKPSTESGLSAAYKREYAFLLSQKRILSKQKSSLIENSEAKVAEARAELAKLRSEYLGISGANEKLSAQFDTVQMRSENQGQIFSQLEGMLEQAMKTLGNEKIDNAKLDNAKPGSSKTEQISLAEQLQMVFSGAKVKLKAMSTVTEAPGEFFLPSGVKANGKIVSVGGIAAYGQAGSFTGALMPAGDGFLKARPELSMARVDLKSLMSLSTLPIYVFEDVSKEVKEAKAQTVFETVESGGSIAWIIVFLGFISLGVVGLRAYRLRGLCSFDSKKLEQIERSLAVGQIAEAKKMAVSSKGAMGRLVQTGLSNFSGSSQQLEDGLSEVISAEQVKIERFGTMILVFASVAPLMGLLGTVTGMISTFDIITQYGAGDPKLLSGGISEALITTELGLVVAIPSLLLGNFLSGWATNIQNQMENFALRLMNTKDKLGQTEGEV